VLDDDPAAREITALFLAHSGYLVETAGDGEQGWEALQSGTYDLLVTDHHMPRLTGVQLVKRLRVAGLGLPVILASGSPELREAWDDRQLALTAVLLKPFPFSDLISIARRAAPLEPETVARDVHGGESEPEQPIQPTPPAGSPR
jgi:CheY-like chemotaxis protein